MRSHPASHARQSPRVRHRDSPVRPAFARALIAALTAALPLPAHAARAGGEWGTYFFFAIVASIVIVLLLHEVVEDDSPLEDETSQRDGRNRSGRER